jgi:hypothetical protein
MHQKAYRFEREGENITTFFLNLHGWLEKQSRIYDTFLQPVNTQIKFKLMAFLKQFEQRPKLGQCLAKILKTSSLSTKFNHC